MSKFITDIIEISFDNSDKEDSDESDELYFVSNEKKVIFKAF